ncbi:hypothetical protein [Streptomyces sp. Ag109_G2-15]|uniref:hypothetical protein n=1 Tax=Streptomyces sp. Ag109_G2-15 TaxID=1938850 RepID=UPI0015CF3696|nr:hypothetical protein [Streptomyces sp. Ag109_G2-15]
MALNALWLLPVDGAPRRPHRHRDHPAPPDTTWLEVARGLRRGSCCHAGDGDTY